MTVAQVVVSRSLPMGPADAEKKSLRGKPKPASNEKQINYAESFSGLSSQSPLVRLQTLTLEKKDHSWLHRTRCSYLQNVSTLKHTQIHIVSALLAHCE